MSTYCGPDELLEAIQEIQSRSQAKKIDAAKNRQLAHKRRHSTAHPADFKQHESTRRNSLPPPNSKENRENSHTARTTSRVDLMAGVHGAPRATSHRNFGSLSDRPSKRHPILRSNTFQSASDNSGVSNTAQLKPFSKSNSKVEPKLSAILQQVKETMGVYWNLISEEDITILRQKVAAQLETNQLPEKSDFNPRDSTRGKKEKRKEIKDASLVVAKLTPKPFLVNWEVNCRSLSISISKNLRFFLKTVHTFIEYYRKALKKTKADKDQKLRKYITESSLSFLGVLRMLKKMLPTLSPEEDPGLIVDLFRVRALASLDEQIGSRGTPISEKILPTLERTPFSFLAKKILDACLTRCNKLFYVTSALLTCMKNLDASLGSMVYTLGEIFCAKDIIVDTLNDVDTFFQLRDTLPTENSEFVPPSGKSIWNEDQPKINENSQKFRPGTLNNLVIRLTSDSDHEFVQTFFRAYSCFTSANELWHKLVERFSVPATYGTDYTLRVKRQTGSIIAQWIKRDAHLLDVSLLYEMMKFSEQNLQKDFPQLTNFIHKAIAERKERFSLIEHTGYSSQISIHALQCPPHLLLFYFDPRVVAEQLTFIDVDLYKKISEDELSGQSWYNGAPKAFSLNVSEMMQHSDRLCLWAATCILLLEDAVSRADMLRRLIGVAEHLRNMRNYHSLLGILSGINNVCITRLKHTLSLLPKTSSEMLESLSELQDPTNSFRKLRNAILEAGGVNIPYLGIYLGELIQIDGGNPDTVSFSKTTMINIQKHNMITQTILKLLDAQSGDFGELQNQEPLYTFLYDLPALVEKELDKLSVIREPKEQQHDG